MKRFALIVILCLPAAQAQGTFELQDPAAQTMEELENEKKNAGQTAAPESEEVLVPGESPNAGAVSTTRNIGGTSCSDFVFYRQAQSQWYWPSLYWLQGFVNGADYRRSAPASESAGRADPKTAADWVAGYCREHPTDRLARAAAAYLDSI